MLQCIKYNLLLKSKAQTALMEGHLLVEKHYTSAIITLDTTLGHIGRASHALHFMPILCSIPKASGAS